MPWQVLGDLRTELGSLQQCALTLIYGSLFHNILRVSHSSGTYDCWRLTYRSALMQQAVWGLAFISEAGGALPHGLRNGWGGHHQGPHLPRALSHSFSGVHLGK